MTQGERVKEIRKNLSLTLEKFGEKVGAKKNTISAIETGRNSLTEQMAVSICRDDIVNIGLHFFLKNVRPYAASCNEA